EEGLADLLADDGDLPVLLEVEGVEEASLRDDRLLEVEEVGMDAAYVEGAGLFLVADPHRSRDEKAGGDVVDPVDSRSDRLSILLRQLDPPARLEALVGRARLPGEDEEAVDGVVAKLPDDAVLESLSRSEQDDEHENAPGDAESRQRRP